MSQGIEIEGIRHFRKSLGISGNDWAIEGIPVLPRQLGEFQAFPEMSRQLGEFLNFSLFYLHTFNSGKSHRIKKSTLNNYVKLS